MGTYRIFATACTAQSGNWSGGSNPATNAELLSCANNGGHLFCWPLNVGEGRTTTARFETTGKCIQLDGAGPLLGVNDLPPGFHITSCGVSLSAQNFLGTGGPTSSYAILGEGNESVNGSGNNISKSYSFASPPVPSLYEILSNGFGVRAGVVNSDGNTRVEMLSLVLSGIYDLLSSSFSWEVQDSGLSNPIQLLANSIINAGNLFPESGVVKYRVTSPGSGSNPNSFTGSDIVTVISPASVNPSNLTPLNLLGITAWYLNVTPPINIIPSIPFILDSPSLTFIPITPEFIDDWTPTEFIFVIPPYVYPIIIDYWINNPVPIPIPVEIIVVGDGTQFSGSVSLGILYILLEDASGIYVIDENQTSDVLYFRGGNTTDLNILMINPPGSDELLYEEDFYNLLQFPYKILSQSYLQDEFEQYDFFITSVLDTVVITDEVEIPSPFIKTAFIP